TRRNNAYAVFGQLSYTVAPKLRVTLGSRYTIDEVTATHKADLIPGYFDAAVPDGAPIALVPFARLHDTFRSFTWRIAADYDLAEHVLAYA
ncbi:TonB-dependent receptor, partial [Acinetobacter baumannii]